MARPKQAADAPREYGNSHENDFSKYNSRYTITLPLFQLV